VTGASTCARSSTSIGGGATRCSRRSPSTCRRRRRGRGRAAGCSWARLPEYLDTTDLLARALRENVAFVPGRAAYLDGRGGTEMRLNFSGVSEADIREGVRRIGKVVREQVELYSTLTGTERAEPAAENVVELRRRAG
jgi:hypothetical protein